jgi:hypothetical protein
MKRSFLEFFQESKKSVESRQKCPNMGRSFPMGKSWIAGAAAERTSLI